MTAARESGCARLDEGFLTNRRGPQGSGAPLALAACASRRNVLERSGKAAGPRGKEIARPGEAKGTPAEAKGTPGETRFVRHSRLSNHLRQTWRESIPPFVSQRRRRPGQSADPAAAARISFSRTSRRASGDRSRLTANSPSATPMERNRNISTGSAEAEGKSRPAAKHPVISGLSHVKKLKTAVGGSCKNLAWIRAWRE